MHKGALVWFFSGTVLTVYALLGLFEYSIPGIEVLVATLNAIPAEFIYTAAFVSIFIEGLYVVGNLFPGTTLVVLLAVLSQDLSLVTFALTIGSIFLGWVCSGVVNIFLASRLSKPTEGATVPVKDNLLMTWFPAFRASYEVAQVVEGANPWRVLRSAIRVRTVASLGAALVCFVIALLIDVNELSNEEGFISVLAVAAIMFAVGIYKVKRRKSQAEVSLPS